MTHFTTQQLQARVTSTRELLQEISNETQRTLRQLTTSDIDEHTWRNYHNLADSIQETAAEAALLADSLRTRPTEPTTLAPETAAA